MGLDMYLNKHIYVGANYEHNNVKGSIKLTIGKDNKPVNVRFNKVKYIIEEAAYWRKANAIHQWFVTNVQEGEDNCQDHYVSIEQLQELIDTCKAVLANHSKAEDLLPPQSGFFFGGTYLDEWYFKSLQNTIDQIEPLLNDKDGDFYYCSSW